MGVAFSGGCILWGLHSLGVAFSGGCILWGILWGLHSRIIQKIILCHGNHIHIHQSPLNLE